MMIVRHFVAVLVAVVLALTGCASSEPAPPPPEMRTITAGIATMAQGSYVQKYGTLMAMTTVATLPVLIIFLVGQRSFVKAITQAGLK